MPYFLLVGAFFVENFLELQYIIPAFQGLFGYFEYVDGEFVALEEGRQAIWEALMLSHPDNPGSDSYTGSGFDNGAGPGGGGFDGITLLDCRIIIENGLVAGLYITLNQGGRITTAILNLSFGGQSITLPPVRLPFKLRSITGTDA